MIFTQSKADRIQALAEILADLAKSNLHNRTQRLQIAADAIVEAAVNHKYAAQLAEAIAKVRAEGWRS
jgi:hypothetical protein